MAQKIPNIGQIVVHDDKLDWVAQVRLGDEQFVLVWGLNKTRFVVGDIWRET